MPSRMAELLSVPLKKSTDVDIVKPLKSLIQSTYNTEDYSDALAELGRLRTNAIWKVFEKSSLDVLYSYYDQLVSLESKLPPQEVQVPFKWKDAFDKGSIFGGRMSLTVSSLAYERVCIQFNMAALQSGLAAAAPLDNDADLQQAAKLLQQAAGLFLHLRGAVPLALHAEPTPDLTPDVLHALHALMLAQAQECVAHKCVRDQMKDGMVARVCAAAAELYADAARALAREQPRALLDRDWLPWATARGAALQGLAHVHQAAVCRAAQRPGEEIARLQAAVAALEPARAAPLLDALRRARARLQAALKDNDFIYHERVPPPDQLEPLRPAVVAKALPPQERYSSAPELFAGLAPAGLHRALAAAESRRAELVQAEVARLREGTALLNAVLASLNLPACLEEDAGGELPASIRAKGAALRAAGGVPALRRLMQDLPDLLQRNREILDEAERLLREEAEADAALRAQFGARWTRTPSAQLTDAFRANAAKYRQIIDNAVRADNIVQQKLAQHQESMELLGGSEGSLAAGLPAGGEGASAGAGAGGGEAAGQLRALMAEVEQLKGARDALEGELGAARADTLREQLEAAPDQPAAVEQALAALLGPLQARAARSLEQQAALEQRLRTAHQQLAAARGGSSRRDHALAALCAAHDVYQELTANLQEGVKFYNDLTQLLVTFQSKVSDYCFARRTEKEELLKDLTQDAARAPAPAPAPASVPGATPVTEPAAERRTAPPRPAPPAPATSESNTLPYPTQPQGMPLPFGAGAPYPYYCAPLPALYNPYATLPYPRSGYQAPPAPAYQPYQYPAPGHQPHAPGYQPPAPGHQPPAPGHQPPAPGYQPPPGGYSPYPHPPPPQ